MAAMLQANGVEPWFRRVTPKYGRVNSSHSRNAGTGVDGFMAVTSPDVRRI
jgi:hypothetical protein